MAKSWIIVGLFLMAFGGFAYADSWIQNDTINVSLPAYDSYSTPSVFQMDGSWYMISGQNNGNLTGFDWTGTQWEQNASINMTDLVFGGSRPRIVLESYSAPTVFQFDGNWNMIIGAWSATSFYGFSWNGTLWVENTSLLLGLPSGMSNIYTKPTVFQLNDNMLYLIYGMNNGTFDGYGWNGTDWLGNSTIIAGLTDVGSHSTPNVFQMDGTVYLVSGNADGQYNGFVWNGTGWEQNNAIVTDLPDIGSRSAPNIFQLADGNQYLVSGETNGGYFGFGWNATVLTPESCGTITENTTYVMTGDLVNLTDSCYVLQGNNILFDCNGYSISLAEGTTGFVGIDIYDSGAFEPERNITIQNCIIEGYDSAIWIHGADYSNVLITAP